MRRIETRTLREKKSDRTKLIMSLVLIGLMVSSTIGFALVFHNQGSVNSNSNQGNSNQETITYNGLDFTRVGNRWQTTFQGNGLTLANNPRETEDINLNIESSISDFANKPLYYIVDEDSSNNIQEIIQNLDSFVSKSQEACLDAESCRNDEIVIKDCEVNNIIILHTSDEIKTYKEGNCNFIESPLSQQILLGDKFIFRVLGIQ